jgi:hypothetical protein
MLISMAIMSKGLKDILAKTTFCYISIKFFKLFLMAYQSFFYLLLEIEELEIAEFSEIFMVENKPFLYFW